MIKMICKECNSEKISYQIGEYFWKNEKVVKAIVDVHYARIKFQCEDCGHGDSKTYMVIPK